MQKKQNVVTYLNFILILNRVTRATMLANLQHILVEKCFQPRDPVDNLIEEECFILIKYKHRMASMSSFLFDNIIMIEHT